jgi:hypothetical protein
MQRCLSLLLLLGAAGCLDPEIPSTVTGEWGGTHLGLVATTLGAELEYDCAAGRITAPVRPDASGRFTVPGLHFPGHGGPIRIDEEQVVRPARYDGVVRRDQMTLTVTLTDNNEELGTFTLVRGASPHVFKCL